MPRRDEPYTLNDIDIFIRKAARLLGERYRPWGVDQSDLTQEMYVWFFGNEDKVRKWLAASPQQTTRIFRSFYDTGLTYAEREKASRVGYDPDDVHWYSQTTVSALLPWALDDDFDGMIRESGDRKGAPVPAKQNFELLTMVLDVRRAVKEAGIDVEWLLVNGVPSEAAYEAAVAEIVNRLGGERTYVGRRRVQSTAAALSATGEDW